jgi:hypothetical protein
MRCDDMQGLEVLSEHELDAEICSWRSSLEGPFLLRVTRRTAFASLGLRSTCMAPPIKCEHLNW